MSSQETKEKILVQVESTAYALKVLADLMQFSYRSDVNLEHLSFLVRCLGAHAEQAVSAMHRELFEEPEAA